MFLGAGKVLKGEGKLGVRDGAQIALEAVLQPHGGFRFTAGDDGGHLLQRGEILADEGGFLGSDKEIEVMHGFLSAAVRAGGGDAGYLRVEAQETGDFLDQRSDAAEQEGVGEVFPQGDGFEDFHLRLRAEAGEPGDPAGLAGGLEIGDRRDREHLVECLDLLRPEALQVEKLEEPGWKPGAEFFVKLQFPGGGELVELVPQGIADALDADELVAHRTLDDVAVEIQNGFGALAVGADFERVLVLELEQQGDFFEDFGKALAGHGGSLAWPVEPGQAGWGGSLCTTLEDLAACPSLDSLGSAHFVSRSATTMRWSL